MGERNSTLEKLAQAHAELHHYTGEGGLKGIFESNSFHASYFSDMNDAHEIREIRASFEFDLARRLTPLVERLRKTKPSSHPVWKPGAPTTLANTLVSTLYRTVFPEGGDGLKALCCTTSFCSHAADQGYEREHGLLSQWRGYGGSGGYCLVFDTSRLLKMFESEASQFLYAYTDAQVVHYPRTDISLYQRLISNPKALLRTPMYGDYALDTSPIEKPQRRTPSAHFRYSTPEKYAIAKGTSVKKPNGYEAIFPVADLLASQAFFAGSAFSQGDAYIESLRKGATSTGNAAKWRWASTDHHLTSNVDRIAEIFGLSRAPVLQDADAPPTQGDLFANDAWSDTSKAESH